MRSVQHTAEFLHLVEHVKTALKAYCSEVVKLAHHEFLHKELVNYALCRNRVGVHLVNVEPYKQLLFLLQMRYVALGVNLQPLVVRIHMHLAEVHRAVGTTHHHLEVQRDGKSA